MVKCEDGGGRDIYTRKNRGSSKRITMIRRMLKRHKYKGEGKKKLQIEESFHYLRHSG